MEEINIENLLLNIKENGIWENKKRKLLDNFSQLEHDKLELIAGKEIKVLNHIKTQLDISLPEAVALISLA